jgi:hypothetical protein
MMNERGDIAWYGGEYAKNNIYVAWNREYTDGGCPSDQPVPEPSTMAMLTTGVLGLIGFEFRRRRAGK